LEIKKLRKRQIRNFCVALMVSRGIPMIHMGDEYGHTKRGNNNTWCQDNELNYYLWEQNQKEEGLLPFFSKMIHFRKTYTILQNNKFVSHDDIKWHGKHDPSKPDWSEKSRFVAFTLMDTIMNEFIYVAFNTSHLQEKIVLPFDRIWLRVVDTSRDYPDDFVDDLPPVGDEIYMQPYSAVVLKATVM